MWYVFLLFFSCSASSEKAVECIKSFVTYYDCSQEGRYTHEYHPFLLQETRNSFEQLESFFIKEGFSCPSRMVIMGYQEEGVPPFLPSFDKVFLQDEYVHQSAKGRTVPAHNVFGFLTGFLLKDASWMQHQWFGDQAGVVYHHLPDRMPLFNDYAYLFQKHAFGEDLAAILRSRDAVERSLKTCDGKAIMKELAEFWQRAYKGELKNFSHQILATQDILFSIDYAQHLLKSNIPVTKIYTGPDITYPIEVLSCQEQKATESAQKFVDYFGKKLVPVNGKKTAYIFCSFVDGVGKSTLLGNVINWKLHGSDLNTYARVDNSSSQRSTLYQLDDAVFILDLPAQLSHFVSKPDGYVFVPLDVAGQDNEQEVLKHISFSINESEQRFEQFFDTVHDPSTLYEHFIFIASLFGEHEWIPFEYNQRTYIVKKDNPNSVRVAVPLEGVQSRGLKVAHPTHMLFTKGLSLPMHTDAFMQDCAQKLKSAGVETLIFIDFLSMYPRSSRENIRVNFILQELKKLYGSRFDREKSLYKTLTNGNLELLYELQHHFASYTFALLAETVVRTALYELFNQHATRDICVLSSKEVTAFLWSESARVLDRHKELLVDRCQKKIALERQALHYLVDDPTFQTVVNFSWKPLLAFSCFMENLWCSHVDSPLMRSVWIEHMRGAAEKRFEFSAESKDKTVMEKVIPLIRASWYVSLINLLYARVESDGVFVVDNLLYPTAPCTLVLQKNDTIALKCYPLEEVFDVPHGDIVRPFLEISLPVGYTPLAWGNAYGTVFMKAYDGIETATGIFGLGYDWEFYNRVRPVVDSLFAQGNYRKIVTSSAVLNSMRNVATKQQKKQIRTIAVDSPYRQAIAFVVRALATLEMIAKDQSAVIITRRGNSEDFKAALFLAEHYLLPDVCGITIEGPLFDDYQTVQPVIPWDVITSYA